MSWHRRSIALRRVTVGAALAAYLVATVGVPLPKSAGKHAGAPFPCQDHVCGCQGAEECWEHCCCYSPAEKLAWAHEHGVDPPAALVAQVGASALATHQSGNAERPRSCCSSGAHAAGHARDRKQTASCDHDHDDESHAFGVELAMGPLARQCRGLVDFWCLSGAVLLPEPAIGWNFEWIVVEWLAPAASPFDSRDLAPPVPPPRV